MAIEQTINKPSRMLTFLNENNDKRVVEWVIDTVSDSTVLTNWDNIVDLGEENIETTIVTSNSDMVSQKEYSITQSSSGGKVTLNLETGVMSKGAICSLVGTNAYVPVLSEVAFNYSDLAFYKNGVLLRKGPGTLEEEYETEEEELAKKMYDVFYDSTNTIKLTNQVEKGDWIAVVKIMGE